MTARKLTGYAMLLAVALILTYLESLIPVPVPIPGYKLGLANVVTLFAIYYYDVKVAFVINILRIVIIAILFGNFYAFIFSISGALLALLIMALLKMSDRFGIIAISVAGAVFHNIGQIMAAMLVLSTNAVLYYLPLLMIVAVVSGIIIGLLAGMLLKRVDCK